MKLKTIASIFNRNKYLTIFTTPTGEQWICNGVAMYSLRGMPRMTPEVVLRVFDVPPDKHEKWICKESEMPTVIDYEDSAADEIDIEPLKINLEWRDNTYWLFPDGRRIYSFNEDFIKPLLDEPDYLTYHKRETTGGGFVLACKVGFELKAIICPAVLHENEDFAAEIARIAGHRRYTACMELVAEGKREFAYIPCGIHAERDEIKERILLIMTNSTTRELSDWEKMKQAEELQKHFAVLKKRDNLPGRVRDLVAEALNTSSTQIARMNAITNNLAPELKNEFQEGRLGLSAAYELSGLSEETQKKAVEELREKGGLSLNDVKEKKQEITPTDAAQPPIPAPEPRDYPETPPDFTEGAEDEEDEQNELENKDFADMSAEEKITIAVALLNRKRFILFAPGEDTRIYDFIIETLDNYAETRE